MDPLSLLLFVGMCFCVYGSLHPDSTKEESNALGYLAVILLMGSVITSIAYRLLEI